MLKRALLLTLVATPLAAAAVVQSVHAGIMLNGVALNGVALNGSELVSGRALQPVRLTLPDGVELVMR